MNKEKTKPLGLGTWSSRSIWPLEWLVSAPTLSLLGIKFSHSIVETAGRVWNDAFGSLNGFKGCHEAPMDGKSVTAEKTVIYRTVKQGGLGMVNTHLFYRSFFLCFMYKVLTGPNSPESSLLQYWMSFPLRTLLPLYKDNTVPVAVMKRPYYLQEPLHQIKQLFASSILVQGNQMVHRKTYNHWVLEVTTMGKLEILRPNLDWPRIWKATAALPTTSPYQDQMPSVGSQQGRKMPNLPSNPETDEHLMFQCPERLTVCSWFEGIMSQKGCKTSKEDLIRGHFGPIGNLRQAFTLLAAYIFINWKARNHQLKSEKTKPLGLGALDQFGLLSGLCQHQHCPYTE
ncbi:hypothetical protein OUZ56_016425 [Daphnia magna]|uniref:Uncharacterized protein n=1 Tax=Daphnia magna TaxID=35525 RepID=A0ABR0AQN1_9CRUS|nr:hypothetical protein OUZ56_016425 [Daphnia magna]